MSAERAALWEEFGRDEHEDSVSVCSDDFDDDLQMFNVEERARYRLRPVPSRELDSDFRANSWRPCPMEVPHSCRISSQIFSIWAHLPRAKVVYLIDYSLKPTAPGLPKVQPNFVGWRCEFYEVRLEDDTWSRAKRK